MCVYIQTLKPSALICSFIFLIVIFKLPFISKIRNNINGIAINIVNLLKNCRLCLLFLRFSVYSHY